MGLRVKIALATGAVLLGTTGASIAFFANLATRLSTERIEEKAHALAQNLAANSRQAVYNEDLYRQLGPLLKGMLEMPDVVAAGVADASGRRLAHAGADLPDAAETGWSGTGRARVFAAKAPVLSPTPGLTAKGGPIGSSRVVLSFERLGSGVRRMLTLAAAFAVLVIAAGLAASVLLARHLTRPIEAILRADEAVVRGDSEHADIPEADIPADEIGRIMRSRSAMFSALRRSEGEARSLAVRERARAEDLEKAFRELKGLREQLTQAEKLSVLGQVLSGVAHEINNPLTGIMGFSELLLKENLIQENPTIREDLSSILREAQRCQAIVKNLTAFARKHKPEKTYISINEIIEECLRLDAYQLKTRDISVRRELDHALPMTMADYHQLQQVFMNLIVNAQQAMTDHGVRGNLTVRTRISGGMIRAEVEDDGPGIPAENLQRVFEPFFTTKEPGKGTGLGLSLSYGIVSDHGGSIHAESSPGKGALFVVELPVLEEIRSGDGTARTPAQVPAGLSILVVDDESVIREVLARILRSLGCSPDAAADGEEAVKKLEKNRYDAVYCDVRMPRLDGMSLYRWVRENRPELAARWIFVTGSAGLEPGAFAYETGRPCIHKPFTLDRVGRTLAEVLGEEGS